MRLIHGGDDANEFIPLRFNESRKRLASFFPWPQDLRWSKSSHLLRPNCPSHDHQRLLFLLEKLIYKEHIIVDELRKKNKEQSLKSLQLKEQGAENVSVGYCHPQCFIYRMIQTLQKNETLKKCTNYVLLYQRSCITS